MARVTVRYLVAMTMPLILGMCAVTLGGCSWVGTGSAQASVGCASLTLARSGWSTNVAMISVMQYVAEHYLGCVVKIVDVSEDALLNAVANGDVDAVAENWGSAADVDLMITAQGLATDLGPVGTTSTPGWYVPTWMARRHPGITSYRTLNTYASLLRTGDSEGRGRLLASSPSDFSYDRYLIENLDLNLTPVYTSGENDLVAALKKSQKDYIPLLVSFRLPHWITGSVPLTPVALPVRTEGCDIVVTSVTCGYGTKSLNKVANSRFLRANTGASTFIRNFTWTNADAIEVATRISGRGERPETAAGAWVRAHTSTVEKWLIGTGKTATAEF
jgi:glycine betaine/proline transport system substrate-binding protein